MVKIDFSAVKDFEPVPAGEYEAQFSKGEVTQSKEGKPMVKVQFTVTEEGEFSGRKLFRNYSLQPNALWAIKQDFVKLGVDPDDFGGEVDIAEMCAQLVGADCILTVKNGEWNGKQTSDITNIQEARVGFGAR